MSFLIHIVLLVINFSTVAFALNENPMSGWDFVAVIEKPKNNVVSLIILKDRNNLFDDKKLMEELRLRFSKTKEHIDSAWLYSMKFENGKRFETVAPIDNQLVISIRNLLNYQMPSEFEREKKKNATATE